MQQYVNKMEAHLLIDGAIGENLFFTEFDPIKGISKKIKKITKDKGKKLINKAKTVIQTGKNPMIVLNLYDKNVLDLERYSDVEIIKQLFLYIK